MLKPSNTMKSPSSHSQESSSKNSLNKAGKNTSSLRFSSKEHTLDKKMPSTSGSTSRNRKKIFGGEDVEYADNGNTSPLYTNWDQDMHEHLLPLQHYILEQAKMSGGYRGGSNDHYDSDSIRSESPSEHSLSGNEPDVEDSDHSDGRDYLAHNPYDYGAHKYYNYDNYNRNMSREDM